MGNSGINVASEMDGVYRPERAKELTERIYDTRIYDTLERVIAISRSDDVPTNVAADRMAEHRLREVRALKRLGR